MVRKMSAERKEVLEKIRESKHQRQVLLTEEKKLWEKFHAMKKEEKAVPEEKN